MTKKVVRKRKGAAPSYKGSVRHFTINGGLPSPKEIRRELKGYRDVLMGRKEPPFQKGVMTLMECAEAYFARACEIEQNILEEKHEGRLTNKEYDRLRTMEIRSFKELFKSATELGSRRITYEQRRAEQEMRGLESI